MKKILLSLLAVAALASCSKMTVEYDTPQEIGFKAVVGNITKAPVDGTVFPTDLNLFVNAYTADNAGTSASTPNYIKNGEFTYLNTYDKYVTDDDATDAEKATAVWGGGSSSEKRNPYYWPNEKTLHFSGYSKSGTWTSADNNPSYNPSTDALTITDYSPGVGTGKGANDLMWFPSTKYVQSNGYGKDTKFVPVNMYHTCSWITFMVQGDITTGASNSTYKITSLTMNGVDMTANVTCTGDASLAQATIPSYVVWTSNTDQDQAEPYNVGVNVGGVELKNTYIAENSTTPKNIETNANTTTGGNIVVIPQVPGSIDLAWTYTSTAGVSITDTATGLSLSLGKETIDDKVVEKSWLPGIHYIYTITIKANEILIAPTPVGWDPTATYNVTVE